MYSGSGVEREGGLEGEGVCCGGSVRAGRVAVCGVAMLGIGGVEDDGVVGEGGCNGGFRRGAVKFFLERSWEFLADFGLVLKVQRRTRGCGWRQSSARSWLKLLVPFRTGHAAPRPPLCMSSIRGRPFP